MWLCNFARHIKMTMKKSLQADAQQKLPDIAASRELTNGSASKEPFVPDWVPVRPGAQDHEAIPSLHCGTRYYRDGRQEVAQ